MDPLTIGMIGSGVAGLAGSILSGSQAQRAARKESARNRAFQERMRDTAWQAAVADMRAAGINPAVAYSKGPASAPSGSMAAQNDILGQGASSAMQAMRIKKELQLLDQQIEATAAQKEKTYQEKIGAEWNNLLWGARSAGEGSPVRVEPAVKGPLWLQAEAAANMATSAARLKELEIPHMKNLAAIANTSPGKYAAWIQYLLRGIPVSGGFNFNQSQIKR